MNDANHKPITAEQREKQRVLALAALTQASFLVMSIAQEGKCELQYFNHCIDALMDEDYINTRHFSLGNSQVKRLLQGQTINHAKQIVSLTASLIALEKKLSKQPDLLKTVAQGMTRIHKQAEYFDSVYHKNVISSVAHLYGETVSTIKPRIIVRGKPEHLSQKYNTEQVRCLLFSGIRAAWVWRTHGGHTLRLLIGRKKLIQQLNNLGHHT